MGRTFVPMRLVWNKSISTHSPRVGRTGSAEIVSSSVGDFNSLAPCGANHSTTDAKPFGYHFNSLAPCGANHTNDETMFSRGIFQLTRPVWGEPFWNSCSRRTLFISTHSPRVGRTSTSCIFVDCSPLLGVDNNFCSRTDCGFLWCSSANRARFSHRLRFAIRT